MDLTALDYAWTANAVATKNIDRLRLVKNEGIVELLIRSHKRRPARLRSLYEQVTGSKTENVEDALRRLSNAWLRELVERSDDITAQAIDEVFEEYRYGARPGFTLHLLHAAPGLTLENVGQTAKAWSQTNDSRTKVLDAYLFSEGEVLEIGFSYETVHEYIDPESETVKSHPELRYGFAWVSIKGSFLAVEGPEGTVTFLRSALAAIDVKTTPISFDKQAVDNVVPLNELQGGSFKAIRPTDEMPTSLRASDPRLGTLPYTREVLSQYERTRGLYQHRFSPSVESKIGFNNRAGRFFVTRRLPASDLQKHAVSLIQGLIREVMAALDDAKRAAKAVDFSDVWGRRVDTTARPMLQDVVYAVTSAKRLGVDSVNLSISAETLLETMPTRWVSSVVCECHACGAPQAAICPDCYETLRLSKDRTYACRCRSTTTLSDRKLICLEDHSLPTRGAVIELEPDLTCVDLVAKASAELPYQPMNPTEEGFRISGSRLLFTAAGQSQVVHLPSEVPELAIIARKRPARLPDLLRQSHALKERCVKAGDCESCQLSVDDAKCLMNVLRLSLGVEPRPHHGQEYGDGMMQLTLHGRQCNGRILAKRGSVGRLTPGKSEGQQLIRQTLAAANDARTDVIVAVAPAPIDDQLVATLQQIVGMRHKKLVVLDEDFIARALATARDAEAGRTH